MLDINRIRSKGSRLITDDRLRWILDTFMEGRNACYFEINPGGTIGDGLLTNGQVSWCVIRGYSDVKFAHLRLSRG